MGGGLVGDDEPDLSGLSPFSAREKQPAVWLYCRFAPGFRDVVDLLAERGLDVSYETVRRWAVSEKFDVSGVRALGSLR
jgi:transposase-like protein|tara:strand:- start:162 stop:398 length:237 start_codon:yes stop_codon:yes gene_type:complete